MIKHHPDDDLLLAFAAGRSEAGPALLVAVHLESCPGCRPGRRSGKHARTDQRINSR